MDSQFKSSNKNAYRLMNSSLLSMNLYLFPLKRKYLFFLNGNWQSVGKLHSACNKVASNDWGKGGAGGIITRYKALVARPLK